MSNVVQLRQPAHAGGIDACVKEALERLMGQKGFNQAYKGLVLEEAMTASAKTRKWFEGFPLNLPADLTSAQLDAIATEVGSVTVRMQTDFLTALVAEAYLRVSVMQQAKDLGMEYKPLKDL